MSKSHKTVRIPSVTLKLLIGDDCIDSAPFRRSSIEQSWPCGCLADYQFDKGDTVQWMPCGTHEPLLPESVFESPVTQA
jgi:hypothetical protein